MTKVELLRLLSSEEDNFVERKPPGVGPGELRQTLCAFANSTPVDREAVLFIGIADKGGGIIGIDNTDALQKRVREAADQCYPAIQCSSEVLDVNGKNVVAVVVPTSARRPHFAGPAYIRQGSESVKASDEIFKRLIYEYHDKCRAIQQHIGKTITVYDKKLNIIGPAPWSVVLVDCTPHVVNYRVESSDVSVTKPLEQIVIDFDHASNRFALRVKP